MTLVWRPGALSELAHSPELGEFVHKAARAVAKEAKANVVGHYPSTRRAKAIDTDSGMDAQSAYADVGYTASHPGFVLWWSEVGTQDMSPRPHLRAALNQVRL